MKYIFLGFILIILIIILKKIERKEYFNNSTYKKTPLYNNSRKLYNDIGVLMNLRPELKANTYSIDLNYNEMNLLLKKILLTKYYFNPANNSIKNLCMDLLKRININYKKLKLNNKFHIDDKREYKLINYDILESNLFSKLTNLCIINIKFYKKLKDIVYTIQCKILYSDITRTYIIKKINIISLELNDKIIFDNLNWDQKYCDLEKNSNTKLQKCHDNIISKDLTKFFKKIGKGDENQTTQEELNFFKEKKKEKIKNQEYKKYVCLGNEGINESTCNSYSFKTGKKGVWDKPCSKDSECPFYMKNKNYPNKRGGCLKGNCEMPINIIKKGYTKYDKNIQPFCYNCNIKNCLGDDCFTCCEKQKTSNLKSADYMFKNDKFSRF